jgi:pimeloyl-ACP methyl ester carboxylesterase
LRNGGIDEPKILNAAAVAAAAGPTIFGESDAVPAAASDHPFTWAFHYDDEPPEIVALDMLASTGGHEGPLPRWRSAAPIPACAMLMIAPGAVASEAAAITVPVLVVAGERDVVPNPWMEPLAFKSSTDISVFVCPRMAHMHNFAHTRHLLWQRIHSWATGVARMRQLATQR